MFGRLITAMATPMTADGALDLEGARTLAAHLYDNASEGLVVSGTTGESPTLRFEEKRDLFAAMVEVSAGRGDVIAGTGTYDTRESIELTEMAIDQGVSGILLVTPYYSRPPQEGLYRHFGEIARAAGDTPVILYDIPSRSGRKIEHDTILRLSEVPNIIGVKDAAGDVTGTARLIADAPGLTVWSGDDVLTLPMLSAGAFGVISVVSHLVGPRIAEMMAAHGKGDVERAASLHREMLPLIDALMSGGTSPVQLKAALEMVGLPAGPLRLPLVEASDDQRSLIRGVLRGLGLV